MQLRRFEPNDTNKLVELFRETVHTVCKTHYSSEQLNAWAPETIDHLKWTQRFANSFTVIAEDNGRIFGFANLESNGCIDMLYVASTFQAKGVGTLLLNALEEQARKTSMARLFSDVSLTARNFFKSRGFIIQKEYLKIVLNVTFPNAIMEKKF
jgi:N-acetylglutamate synthase-like GNAT family acetyltransferase